MRIFLLLKLPKMIREGKDKEKERRPQEMYVRNDIFKKYTSRLCSHVTSGPNHMKSHKRWTLRPLSGSKRVV